MKACSILPAFFILVLVLTCPLPALESFTGRCVGVSDGDTIRVLRGSREVKVRLEGIDCPEKGQPFGQKAKQFTSAMVFDRQVTVKVLKLDRYGRSVGRVSINGRDLSLELVRAGLAWHYKKYSGDPVLAQAEIDARAKKIGLWADPHPVAPWDFRHNGEGR